MTERGIAAAKVQRAARSRIDERLASKAGAEAVQQARKTLTDLIELGKGGSPANAPLSDLGVLALEDVE